MTHWVKTGRVDVRRRCESCNIRIKRGEPQATDSWPRRLSLTTEQADLLLVAAADYRDICRGATEPERVVEFVDWVIGVARQDGQHVEHDGAPPRNEIGTLSDRRETKHRHPDPIPMVSLPPAIRSVAR